MSEASGKHFRDEDWYADDLADARYVECTFTGLDLPGAVLLAELHGADVDPA